MVAVAPRRVAPGAAGPSAREPAMATVAPSDAEPEGGRTSLGKVWLLLRMTGEGFIADDAWSRGASIAYFTLFSVAPTLLEVNAVAGLAFGQERSEERRVGKECRSRR